MLTDNLEKLTKRDTVKFVVGSRADMERALEVTEKYNLQGRTAIYFSPVFGRIEPAELVNFLAENKLNDMRVQIQMHKVIWEPDKRRV